MTSEQLQEKFKGLSDILNNLKLEKAKAEANLETLVYEKTNSLNQLKVLTNVETIEKAEEKLIELKQQLIVLAEQAEAILDANE